MGNTKQYDFSVFVYKCFKLRYFHTNTSTFFLNKENVGKIKKTFINVYCNYACRYSGSRNVHGRVRRHRSQLHSPCAVHESQRQQQ